MNNQSDYDHLSPELKREYNKTRFINPAISAPIGGLAGLGVMGVKIKKDFDPS